MKLHSTIMIPELNNNNNNNNNSNSIVMIQQHCICRHDQHCIVVNEGAFQLLTNEMGIDDDLMLANCQLV